MFNKIETWDYLEEKLGTIELKKFNPEVFGEVLQDALDSGQTIYSNAYILCANKAFGFDRKHLNQLALVKKMIQVDKVAANITRAHSLEEIFHILLSYPLIGNFMAYQLTIDINYSEVIDFSENDFTIAGPGAERGIRKCFIDTGNLSNADIIRWMTENQDVNFQRLGIDLIPYRLLCNDVQREGVKSSPALASGLLCYAPLHNIWYGVGATIALH